MSSSSSKKNRNTIKIYESNCRLKTGIGIWTYMVKELFESRGLIWRLVVRDITSSYKQSILGILWVFIAPLFIMLAFIWVKEKNILPIGKTEMPYAAFMFTGQMIWLFFSQGITSATSSLVTAGNMLTKINFPREVLIFSAIGTTIFNFLIRIPLLLAIYLWVDFTPDIKIIFMPFILLPLFFLIIGFGFILSLLNAVMRDIRRVLGIIINLGMFATPVIYPPPQDWPFSFLINIVNPVSSFITAARDLATSGNLSNPYSYLLSLIFSLLIFFTGWRLFHLTEPKIAERV